MYKNESNQLDRIFLITRAAYKNVPRKMRLKF